ncbi:retrovirus-related pol polyprotein from transposon TNT 1-94 [Tanacetum coccineum]
MKSPSQIQSFAAVKFGGVTLHQTSCIVGRVLDLVEFFLFRVSLQALIPLIESINGKKYILVIVDDYSRYAWTHFLRPKDETPENGVVDRQNRTLVEAARTMLLASKLPLFFRAKAIATASDKPDTSLQELDLLFSPMYEEYFTIGNQSLSKSSALYDNIQQQDKQPTLNVQPTLEPITPPTNVNAEENNTDQAIDA